MFFSLILACSTPTTTTAPSSPLPAEAARAAFDEACKNDPQNKVCAEQYPGGVYNITMGGKVIGLNSIAPPLPKLAGAPPRGGLELYCFADGTGFPYLSKKSDGTDEPHPWSVRRLDGGDPCAGLATEMFVAIPCKDGCPTPETGGSAMDEAKQDGLQPGVYEVTDWASKTARVRVSNVAGESHQRLETWCLPDEFRWPEKDKPWSMFTMIDRAADPDSGFKCGEGVAEVKYVSSHVGTIPKP